jgi:hypothetical protein
LPPGEGTPATALGQLAAYDDRLPRHHYGLCVIDYFCRLVLEARTSMHAAPRVLRLFFPIQAQQDEIPHATSGRWWLLRLGYYKLHRPQEQADDWVWLADHAVQIGKQKFLGIVGIRLAHLPPLGEYLQLKHLEPIALLPVETSNGQVVHRQLEDKAKEDGVPRAILSDEGSDLASGVKRFCQEHVETTWLSDTPHKAARLLKRRLEQDEHWSSFCTQAGQTKSQTGQTELAFLAPPRQRSKARYMNLQSLLTWAERTLQILDEPPPQVLDHCITTRIEEKFGWLRDYREFVARWLQWLALTETTVELVRREGYSATTASRLPQQLSPLIHNETTASLRDELVSFVSQQSAQATVGERLPGSTEVLESSFGKLKAMEGDHQHGGFTGMILAWAALFGETTTELIARALSCTPTKVVQRWLSTHLGPTLQSKRRGTHRALAASAPEKPEDT